MLLDRNTIFLSDKRCSLASSRVNNDVHHELCEVFLIFHVNQDFFSRRSNPSCHHAPAVSDAAEPAANSAPHLVPSTSEAVGAAETALSFARPLTSTKKDARRVPISDSDVDSAYDDKGSSNFTSKRPSPATNEHNEVQFRLNISPIPNLNTAQARNLINTNTATFSQSQGQNNRVASGNEFSRTSHPGSSNVDTDVLRSALREPPNTIDPAMQEATTATCFTASNKLLINQSKSTNLLQAQSCTSSSIAGDSNEQGPSSSRPLSSNDYRQIAEKYEKMKENGNVWNFQHCKEDISFSVISDLTEKDSHHIEDSVHSSSRCSEESLPTSSNNQNISCLTDDINEIVRGVEQLDSGSSLSSSVANGLPPRSSGSRQLESTRMTNAGCSSSDEAGGRRQRMTNAGCSSSDEAGGRRQHRRLPPAGRNGAAVSRGPCDLPSRRPGHHLVPAVCVTEESGHFQALGEEHTAYSGVDN